MDMLGADYISNILNNDSAITAIVSTSIYNARVIPQTDTNNNTINFYRITPYSGGSEIFQVEWSIDCKSDIETISQEIADNVLNAFNRIFGNINSKTYYGVCDIINTIPPIDETDVYNTSVQLTLKRR